MNPATSSVCQLIVGFGIGGLVVIAVTVVVILLGKGTGEKLMNGD